MTRECLATFSVYKDLTIPNYPMDALEIASVDQKLRIEMQLQNNFIKENETETWYHKTRCTLAGTIMNKLCWILSERFLGEAYSKEPTRLADSTGCVHPKQWICDYIYIYTCIC